MKYLRLFQTEAERSTYKSGPDFILPNVNYVVESNSLEFNPYVEHSVKQRAGDIVYYVNGVLKTVSYTNWSSNLGTPVGVITIPKGFAPDGKARMIALSGYEVKVWCNVNAYADTNLTNYLKSPLTDNTGFTDTDHDFVGLYLPSDEFIDSDGPLSYVDPCTKYDTSYASFGYEAFIPSPYITRDGVFEPNPEYYKTILLNGINANGFSDFNGLNNTRLLVELDSVNYEAANHCWTYNDGVSNTQWYLPAMGELGYMMPRLKDIKAGLAKLNIVNSNNIYTYLSSSEIDLQAENVLIVNTGCAEGLDKDQPGIAAPWAIVE